MEGEWHFLFPLAHWCVTFTGVGHFCKHLKFLAALLVKDISFKWSLDQLSVVYGDDASVPLGLCVQLYLVFVCLNSLSCLTKALVFQAEQCLVSADSNQRFSDKILITIQLSGYYWVRKTALPEKTPMWIHGSACFPAVSFEWALMSSWKGLTLVFFCASLFKACPNQRKPSFISVNHVFQKLPFGDVEDWLDLINLIILRMWLAWSPH